MNDSILMAIESLCDDIASNTDAEDNRLRAEAISILAASGKMIPDEAEKNEAATDDLATLFERGDVPQPGDQFTYNGMDFIILGIEQGGVLAVEEQTLDEEMPYDKDGSNDWRKATLRKYLNEEHIKKFNKGDLLPFVSTLISTDKRTNYGTSKDYIFLLSYDLFRKYRALIPYYGTWVWTITPATSIGEKNNVEYNNLYSIAPSSHAKPVAPACLFKLSVFTEN